MKQVNIGLLLGENWVAVKQPIPVFPDPCIGKKAVRVDKKTIIYVEKDIGEEDAIRRFLKRTNYKIIR